MMLIKELLAWIDRQTVTLDEIWSRKSLWQYHRVIKEEILAMEQAVMKDDVGKQKYHMKRVEGYFLTCQRKIREGKA